METTKENLIFLVDDDKMFLKSMEHYIHQFFKKFTIKTFSTGEECLNFMHQKPDVILLDYILNANYPDAMNGIKVLNEIKKVNPESSVIMFSGQDHIDVAVDTMKNGAFDYIVKNDKIFIRVQNAIKNVLYAVSLKQDMKDYKRKMLLFGLLVFVLIAFALFMQIYFKTFLSP